MGLAQANELADLRRSAASVYRWLWWSPLLTIPTLAIIYLSDPGYAIVCRYYRGCDYDAALRITGFIAIAGSALWHLLLLRRAADSRTYVRGHGRQGLLLAAIRTLLALYVVALEQFVPALILLFVWFFGNLWGGRQVQVGDCWWLRWRGAGEALPLQWPTTVDSDTPADPVARLLRSNMALERQRAAASLGKVEASDLDTVKSLQRAAEGDPNPWVRAAAEKALEAPAHQLLLAQMAYAGEPLSAPGTSGPAGPAQALEQGLELAQSGQHEAAVGLLLRAFRTGDAPLRLRALDALDRLGQVEVF